MCRFVPGQLPTKVDLRHHGWGPPYVGYRGVFRGRLPEQDRLDDPGLYAYLTTKRGGGGTVIPLLPRGFWTGSIRPVALRLFRRVKIGLVPPPSAPHKNWDGSRHRFTVGPGVGERDERSNSVPGVGPGKRPGEGVGSSKREWFIQRSFRGPPYGSGVV